MTEDQAIQGIAPARIVHTENTHSYADAVRLCSLAGETIADYGTAHHALGHAPPPDHVQIITPAGVIEHYIPDMAVRVAAGTTLTDLQSTLSKEGQYLPLDGASGTQTIGEIIAHNVHGPLRLSHGTMRDLLLGLRYIDAAGRIISVGGRTVKNVAGYDVTRLMAGSLNTLGLIAEATLRTAAIPQQVTRIALPGLDPAALDLRVTGLLTSDASPFYLDGQITINADGSPSHALYLAYAATPAGCDAHHAALLDWLGSTPLSAADPARHDADLADDAAARAGRRVWRATAPAVVKVIAPPASTGHVANALLQLIPRPHTIDTLPAHGIIHLGADSCAAQAIAADASILDLLRRLGGMRIWLRRPDHTPAIPPFAPDQPDWPMLRKIKQTMDPQNIFNPGRFL